MTPFLEIACFTPQSAVKAQTGGASRIEFCADPSAGGITPSLADFTSLRPQISIPIYVMIRPRAGDFLYSGEEFETMKESLLAFAEAGADGFVFGILDAEKNVDVGRNSELVKLAGRPCTFHRAFDEISGEAMETALEELVGCGFKAILTSGGRATAVAGVDRLKELVGVSRGRIGIIVGGGVRADNVGTLRAVTAAEYFHSSAIVGGGGGASLNEVTALREVLRS